MSTVIGTNQPRNKMFRVPFVATGGTISSQKTTAYGGREAGAKNAKILADLVSNDLAAQNIQISKLSEPYTILSENIDLVYFEKLVDELITIIKNEKPELIVVSHGTDSMDKVVNLLDYPVDETSELKLKAHQALNEKIEELQKLINKNEVKIVFTGSNTEEEAEARFNLKSSFLTLNNYPKLKPGVYINFHESLIQGQDATKDIYDPQSGMRYIEKTNPKYKTKLQLQAQKDSVIIEKLKRELKRDDNSGFSLVSKLDVTQLRANNDVFKESNIPYTVQGPLRHKVYSKTKAVLLILHHGGTANVNSESEASIIKLIKELREINPHIVFFGVSENFEPIDLQAYTSSLKLLEAGIVPLYDMSKNVAYAKLNLLNIEKFTPTEIIDGMLTSTADEVHLTENNRKTIASLKKNYYSQAA